MSGRTSPRPTPMHGHESWAEALPSCTQHPQSCCRASRACSSAGGSRGPARPAGSGGAFPVVTDHQLAGGPHPRRLLGQATSSGATARSRVSSTGPAPLGDRAASTSAGAASTGSCSRASASPTSSSRPTRTQPTTQSAMSGSGTPEPQPVHVRWSTPGHPTTRPSGARPSTRTSSGTGIRAGPHDCRIVDR
jgi:hypothetical protein